MKLSKEELKKKIDEKIEDEDLKIELLEDIEDSVEIKDESEETYSKEDYESLKAEVEELKKKYKERFLSSEEKKEEETEEGLENKEVIDVKEIFKDEEEE